MTRGNESGDVYFTQFEAAATANQQNSKDLATSLIVALRGEALENQRQDDAKRMPKQAYDSLMSKSHLLLKCTCRLLMAGSTVTVSGETLR